jgi:hypothetical protein
MAHHFPEGPWLQPDGLYVGRCRCGGRFEGRDGGESELAWLAHYREVLSQPAAPVDVVERVTIAIQREATDKGADSPVDYGDAEQLAIAAIAAITKPDVRVAAAEASRALLPFAAAATYWAPFDDQHQITHRSHSICVGDLRRARKARDAIRALSNSPAGEVGDHG